MRAEASELKRSGRSPGDEINFDLIVLGDDTRQLVEFYERLGYVEGKHRGSGIRLESGDETRPWISLPGSDWLRSRADPISTESKEKRTGRTCERFFTIPTPDGVLVVHAEFERGTVPDLLFVYKSGQPGFDGEAA